MKLVCLYAYSREGLLTNEVQNGVVLSRPHDALGRPLGYVCRSADEEGETRSSPEPGDQITRLPALVGTGAEDIRDNPSPLPALSPSAREAVSPASGLRRDSGFSLLTRQMVYPTNRAPRVVEYAYDHLGRMVWKTIGGTNASPDKALAYVWDDYNIVREDEYVPDSSVSTGILHSAFSILHSTHNIWGLDLDGTMQGCGGVGGLLAVVKDVEVYTPTYDANGNISEYVCTNGTIVAHQEYDPFGSAIVSSGDDAAFSHWFSTKPWCGVTGMVEYQLRKYRPGMGRWMSRDIVAEKASANLYLMAINAPIVFLDLLGLDTELSNLAYATGTALGIPVAGDIPFMGLEIPPLEDRLIAPTRYPDTTDGFSFFEGGFAYIFGEDKVIHIPIDKIMLPKDLLYYLNPCEQTRGQTTVELSDFWDSFHPLSLSGWKYGGPGRVTWNLSGELEFTDGCCWKFVGQISAKGNRFDFDPRPFGERDRNPRKWQRPFRLVFQIHRILEDVSGVDVHLSWIEGFVGYPKETITRFIHSWGKLNEFDMYFYGTIPLVQEGCCEE